MPGFLTDVPGLRVGHHHRIGDGWMTGTTVVLAEDGAVGGVDARGGAPGTRETDLLRPENLVERVHAVCLTGGSAYGLAAADGVMAYLARRNVGFRVGPAAHAVVPIVPSAVIFDLGRGGRFASRPSPSFGRAACTAAGRDAPASGVVGAGAGAVAGGLKGGIGQSSRMLPDGTVVAALAVVNAAGAVIDPATGLPYGEHAVFRLRKPPGSERRALVDHLAAARPSLNTTIGVVATSAPLDKAGCTRLAAVAQDGLARAVRPAHSMNDGDTIFGLSTAPPELVVAAGDHGVITWARDRNALLAAAADCFEEAVVAAVLAAEACGAFPAYRDLCPSAFRS